MGGTRGLKVYRCNGWYFVWYWSWDAYDIFEDMTSEIPESQPEYSKWLHKKRQYLEELRLELQGPEPHRSFEDWHERPAVHQEQPTVANTDTSYIPVIDEIDLDHEVFLIKGFPVASLRYIARSQRGPTSYGFPGYDPTAPTEARPNWKASPPSVDAATLATFHTLYPDATYSSTVGEVLGVPEQSSRYDSARISFYEIAIGGCMQHLSFGLDICALDRAVHPTEIPSSLVRWATQVLRLPFTCMLIGPGQDAILGFPSEDCQWDADALLWLGPQGDICVQLATHLDDADNLKLQMSKLVEVLRTSSTKPTFGILFSFFHCVFVAMDGSKSSFRATPALQFLPDMYATSPSTPGITTLVRLASLRLYPFVKEPVAPLHPKHFLNNVPQEILDAIAIRLAPRHLKSLCRAIPMFHAVAERITQYRMSAVFGFWGKTPRRDCL
ncbi:polymerase II transcription elongation factor [Mycena kentingensis (nom. inval.)]|nr:polymerase II transcription elongation factor [Mycena kentingensis (nom. inval.)]